MLLAVGVAVGLLGVGFDTVRHSADHLAEATDQHVAISLAGGCAVTDLGAVRCWGPAWDGGLGNGTGGGRFDQHPPALSPVASNITSGATSIGGACALSGQVVRCWGADGVIEDGTGSLFSDPPWGSNVPTDYGHGPSTKVAGGCSLTTGGTVKCYGWNSFGQLGNGAQSWPESGYALPPPSAATAVTVTGLTDVIDLSSFVGGYCALVDDGDDTTSVWCWGLNRAGELGDGQSGNAEYECGQARPCTDSRHSSSPVRAVGIDDAVSVHGQCAVRSTGAMSCWGTNVGGRFDPAGDGGSTAPTLTPTDIDAFDGAVDAAVGSRNACAVLADGRVRCQGSWVLGDGGDGYSDQRSADLALFGSEPENEAVEISTWGGGYCARTRGGQIACWGMGAQDAGIAQSGFDRVLTPTYVIGFGGELPVDELVVSVEIEPAEVELQLDGDGAAEAETVVATVTVKNTSSDDVPNVKLDASLATTLIDGDAKEIAQVGDPVPGPDDETGDVELGTIPDGESRSVAYTFEVSGRGTFGVKALARWADPVTSATETGLGEDTVTVTVDSALEVELTGEATNSANIIKITADIGNDGAGTISDINWESGLVKEVIAGDATPTRLASGPIPALPDTLAPGETIAVRWTFYVDHSGAEVMTLSGSGATDDGEAAASDVLTATITDRQIEAIDHQRQAMIGLQQMLGDAADELHGLWDASIAEARAAANPAEEFYRKNYEAYRQLGFGDTSARFLANGDVQREWVSRYFDSYAEAAGQRLDQLGQQGGEAIYRNGSTAWKFVTDERYRFDVSIDAILWGVDELNYLSDGLADPNRPGVLEQTRTTWDGVWAETQRSIEFAADGQLEIYRLEAAEFAADPFAFAEKMGGRHGDQGTTVAWYTANGIVEEIATGGAGPVTRIGRGLENGVDGFRTVARTDDATDLGDVAGDAFSDTQRRLARAEKEAQKIHSTPYGQRISSDALERYGGFNSADAERVLKILDEVEDNFDGLQIEIAFRTAEPLSVGIDGIGKRAFTKEKAVGSMDLLIGAPPSAAGKVTVFEPVPLPESTIRAIELDNPGFRARYNDRLATQQSNWKKWQAGEGKLYDLVQASNRHPDGIHVLDGVPGQNTYGVTYLEQLDDPVFLATNPQITEQVIAELRATPSTFAKLEVDRAGNGFTFSDHVRTVGNGGEVTLTKKPIISDYDGQAVRPVDGVWPAGVRGQVETLVKQRLDQIGRHGRHGWSGTANDLPSDLFHLPVEYAMSTAHPSVARSMAEDFATRFGELAQQFRVKAQRLENGLDGLSAADRRAVEAQIARLRSTADKYSTYDVDEILRTWPPTEKTIVFSKGRASVGSNGGTS